MLGIHLGTILEGAGDLSKTRIIGQKVRNQVNCPFETKMETFVPFREPPETDLEYYSRPENYTGSNLTSLSR